MTVVLANHQELLAVVLRPFDGDGELLDPDRSVRERHQPPFTTVTDHRAGLLAGLRSDLHLTPLVDHRLGFGFLPIRDDPLFDEMPDLHLRSLGDHDDRGVHAHHHFLVGGRDPLRSHPGETGVSLDLGTSFVEEHVEIPAEDLTPHGRRHSAEIPLDGSKLARVDPPLQAHQGEHQRRRPQKKPCLNSHESLLAEVYASLRVRQA